MRRFFTVVITSIALMTACARPYAPSGGEQDRSPPRLIGTAPEPLAVVPGYEGPVVFRFDERLSERNFSEALIVVSPQDGAVRVERSRSEVRVSIDGGWRQDRVYHVTLLPGVRDLFGNARTESAEIVFSTGPTVPTTAVAGIVLDRITGRPAQNAVVDAFRRGDDVAYRAIGDAEGFFSLRHLPMGVYEMRAFSDQNRNRRRDPAEPVDSGRVVPLQTATDTLPEIFSVLSPDSTPPRLSQAAVVDSLRIRVTFDDYFDAGTAGVGASAVVHALPDSVQFATATRIMLAPVWDRERASARAAQDTAVVAPPVPPAEERPVLPARDLIIELDRPLEPGLTYTVTVSGAANISGLPGGGTVRFETRPRPPGGSSGTGPGRD